MSANNSNEEHNNQETNATTLPVTRWNLAIFQAMSMTDIRNFLEDRINDILANQGEPDSSTAQEGASLAMNDGDLVSSLVTSDVSHVINGNTQGADLEEEAQWVDIDHCLDPYQPELNDTTIMTQRFPKFHYPDDHTCRICYESFDDHMHRPIWTACGHALTCVSCILNIMLDAVDIKREELRQHAEVHLWTGYTLIKSEIAHTGTAWQEPFITHWNYHCPLRCHVNMPYSIATYAWGRYIIMVCLDGRYFRRLPCMDELRAKMTLLNKLKQQQSSLSADCERIV